MDLLLFSLGLCCMIVGIIGSFAPVLPGPPISWIGILLLYATDAIAANYWIIGITLAITLVITVLDYTIPAKGTRRYGGSKYGIWGTNIGLLVGLIAPIPLGFLIGPFVGAFVGEMMYNSREPKRAFRAATGSFIGFLASTFIKFVACVAFLGVFLTIAWRHRAGLFG